MRLIIAISLVSTILIPTIAFTDVYKCVSEDGVVTYSDQPCGEQADVFIRNSDLSVDDAIGNASPYTHPVTLARDIRSDVMLHARKVGRSIFPNEFLKSHDISTEHTGNYYKWNVFLSYVLPNKEHVWSRIVMNYIGEPKKNRISVCLKYISIKRFDWATPLRTLKNVKKLKRHGHYGWDVIAQPQ